MDTIDGLPDDFRDLLLELADANADFVVVGGWAMAVHGRTRATEDLDDFVRPSQENAARVFAALAAFGAPVEQHRVSPEVLAKSGYGYRFGVKPFLVEVLTQISGVDFDEAVRDALPVVLEGRTLRVIGRLALLKNKRAAGRLKDLDDADWLDGHEP